ncbi:MAG TPA: glycosyltransferase, partial [bacterium]|nr:glycosyltransferase [bacterium]
PSLWEGLPRSVLEAFAAGRAVIATDIPGTREVMENGKNGLLVPPRNAEKLREAIRFMFEHPEDVKRMGEEARKASRQYSFDAMVARYHDLYERLISGRSG